MTLEELAQFDQSSKMISETLPSFFWNYFKNLRAAGFTEDQAFTLTRDYQRNFFGGKRSEDA